MVSFNQPKLLTKFEGNDYLIQYVGHREYCSAIDEKSDFLLVDLEILVQPYRLEDAHHQSPKHGQGLQSLLSSILEQSVASWSGTVRLGLSTISGYAVRSRCFEQRFVHCHHLGTLLDNTTVGKQFTAIDSTVDLASVADIIDSSAFAFLLPRHTEPSSTFESHIVDEINEIFARTAFPWLLEQPPSCKTIALVHGRDNIHHFHLIHESASRLNIRLLILDTANHWLQNAKYRHLYDHFLPIDMTVDEGFHLRIVEAISKFGPVDGICTVSDRCLLPVARAADILKLPAQPPIAVQKSINKYETRRLDDSSISSTALLSNVAELDGLLRSEELKPNFPLIVKPSQGWSSELVFKVNDRDELYEAVEKANKGFSKKVLVEAYLDGPELDVNFILHEGNIAFFEIADDFPSPGDQSGDFNSDFFENSNVLPSALPNSEYACVRESMYGLLIRLGFRHGVFHVEAKVQDSAMAFSMENGCMDLRKSTKGPPTAKPRCCVIEINPRPPGFPCVFATRATYGVNMFDSHLLTSLGDHQRLQMLSQPFQSREKIGHQAQIWSQIVFFKADQSGICTSDDACGDFVQKTPELAGKVVEAQCFFQKGDVIPTPPSGAVVFGAFFIVASSTSREDVVQVGQLLRNKFSLPVDAVKS